MPYHQKWLSSRLARQANGWSVSELQEALKGLKRVDRILKSSSIPEDHVLEEWLLGLMVEEKGTTA